MIETKVLIISTGGTIAGKVATDKKNDDVIISSENFTELLTSTLIAIKKNANIDVIIKHKELCNIDSSNITPQQWIDLANIIRNEYDNFDSFIITHGTNTLGYTSAALSFSLANIYKPVILTGSQVPAGMPGSDAYSNLENSLRIAVMNSTYFNEVRLMGVMVVFGGYIITGTRVKKYTDFNYDAFKSYGTGAIGRLGRIIDINISNLNKHNSYLSTTLYRYAKTSKDIIFQNDFDMRIASITEFPNMEINIFQTLVEELDIKGFILRSFGAGDVSSRLIPALEYLKTNKIPIVVTTQIPNGNSNFQVNEPGLYLKEHNLAIPAYDMSIEAQTIKLAWLLAKMNKGEITYSQIYKYMIDDMRGEINVMWETNMI